MNERPRRRRYDDDTDRGGGGLPLFPLIVIVIFAGLLLGGVLAHFFGGASSPHATPGPLAVATPHASPSTVVPVPSPRPSATPTTRATTAHPSPSPVPTHLPTPRPTATATAVKATAVPTATASAAPASTVRARSLATPTPPSHRAVVATAAPPVVTPQIDRAASVVRSYLGALSRGDRATATGYLTRGLPGEVFMDSSARILSVHSSGTSDRYHVVADVQTSAGEYYVNFDVVPGIGGLQIDDHYAIKVR